jgi:RNA polymerase sigma-70 factor (ECF subfamily)
MDSERLGLLIDQLAAALELYARQWCDEPEDVVQEAFVKLAAVPVSPLDPAAWLFRTVRHRAINAGIAKRRRRRHESEAAARLPAWFETGPNIQTSTLVDPESAQAALAALPIEKREIIVAHIWGGLTFDQIAEMVGFSTSSTHRLYQAGLAVLRERLGVSCQTNPSRPIRR